MSKACAAWLLALLACAEPDARPSGGEPVGLSGDAATTDRIARNFVDGCYRQFPEEAFEVGYRVPGAALGDRSLEARAAWQAREDAWLDSLRALDARALEGSPAGVTTRSRSTAWMRPPSAASAAWSCGT